jgi:hypothetical protein
MTVTLRNVSRVPRDLSDGRVLAPGAEVEDFEVTDHEEAGIRAGHLLAIDSAGRKAGRATAKENDES